MKKFQSTRLIFSIVCALALLTNFAFAQAYPSQSYSGQIQGQPVYPQGQQVYPSQAYPAQTYPNQTHPAQNVYPNQGYPSQPYGQPYPVQGQPIVQPQQTLTTSHWAQRLEFGDRNHDFGAVPMASKQEHVFEFKNTLDSEIQLTAVRASCGCTKPKLLTKTVKPGEIAKVLAKFDTMTFKGKKAATVTVSMNKVSPYNEYGEVQFSVKGKIRQDVVVNPGKINFDNATPNETTQRIVEVKYAGDPRWELLDVKSSNPNIEIEKRETSRDVNQKRVTYELVVSLLGHQPLGMFSDQLTLVTNDNNPSSKEMAVVVEGSVKAVIQSSPISLGAITKDEPVKKKLVIRGAQAFSIKDIVVDNPRIMISEGDGQKSLHILDYELDTSVIGPVTGQIKVVSDLPGHPTTTIPFTAQIIQPVATD